MTTIEALKRGIDYAKGALVLCDSQYARAIPKYQRMAETMEAEIKDMEAVLERLELARAKISKERKIESALNEE